MTMRTTFAVLIAVAVLSAGTRPGVAQKPPETKEPETVSALIAALRANAHVRDSLSAMVDSSQGASREYLEELISQRDAELRSGVFGLLDRIKADESSGMDLSEARRELTAGVREDWPRHLAQLQSRGKTLATMGRASDAASGPEKVAIETQMSQQSDHLIGSYVTLVDVLLALEKARIDVSKQRAFLMQGLPPTVEGMVTRVQLAGRARATAVTRLSRDAGNADTRYVLEASDERLKRATSTLTTAIHLMDRLGLPTTNARVAQIAATGTLNTDIFHWPVLSGLMRMQWRSLLDFLGHEAPRWLFQGLLIVFTFLGFRAVSQLVKRGVRRAVKHWHASELMRGTVVRLSKNLVMVIGFAVILTQMGVKVGPLLAGFGIAGVVIGFAMQSTLSNFAAGGMILTNQPFDLGDEIEVAGVSGTVKRMTLVSTTILTPDNQTLILPNSTVWGGVIRNRTAQPTRRVDLTFAISYRDDLDRAEHVLQEIVSRLPNVLKDPVPVIRLHQLADSSMNVVVRVWAPKAEYWNVYWDVTRAVKLGLDREGITIPFPQREIHMVGPGAPAPVPAAFGTPPRDA